MAIVNLDFNLVERFPPPRVRRPLFIVLHTLSLRASCLYSHSSRNRSADGLFDPNPQSNAHIILTPGPQATAAEHLETSNCRSLGSGCPPVLCHASSSQQWKQHYVLDGYHR